MNKPKFFMMCGLVASGKSTRAKKLVKEYNATIFSSDALREELFNDVNDQEHNQELFVELHRRIKECLKSGKNACYDATNLSYKKRMAFLQELKNIPCEKICVLMATPYEECLKRNAQRERKVTEYVIERMYRQFDPPYWYEGWDYIQVEWYSDMQFKSITDWLSSAEDFNQDNPYHSLTLGQHSEKTLDYVFIVASGMDDRSIALRNAAVLHDNGKYFCKTFKNSKGDITEHAHYYNHEHVGSYNSLFYKMLCHPLDVAALVRWHMQPYFWEKDNNKKLCDKYRKLWGEELYQDIMLVHRADNAAH